MDLDGFHVEEVPWFPEQSYPELEYDPACERMDTAIRAIWILYRRDKWDLLGGLGLGRERYEELFTRFDAENITSDHGLLRDIGLVRRFIEDCPGVAVAAQRLIEKYKFLVQIGEVEQVDRKENAKARRRRKLEGR